MLDRLLRHGALKRRLKPLVPDPLRHRVERLRESNRQSVDVLDDSTRAHLEEQLEDEVLRLSRLLGRPVSD